jgi:hypothetical protein
MKAVASKLHETEVEVSVIADKSAVTGMDHVQFLITEKKEDAEKEKMKKMVTDEETASNFPFLSPGKKKE